MAKTRIILEDEYGLHEFESDADCIIITDDMEGNVLFKECKEEHEDECGRSKKII